MPLVEDSRVDLVSFTGSAATGRLIAEATGRRLAKTVMELGGKNALVVCDDADLDRAVEWSARLGILERRAALRCREPASSCSTTSTTSSASGSLAGVEGLDGDRARDQRGEHGADPRGGRRQRGRRRARWSAVATRVGDAGWHLAPTLVEGVAVDAPISCEELFGPVAALYRVGGFEEALELVNASSYGLTAAMHTASLHRAMLFAERVAAGVVVVNAGTHGSEPHMGFGASGSPGRAGRRRGRGARRVLGDAVRQPRRRSGVGVSPPEGAGTLEAVAPVYSFVIPVFNERETLEELYERLVPVLDALDGPGRGAARRRRLDRRELRDHASRSTSATTASRRSACRATSAIRSP